MEPPTKSLACVPTSELADDTAPTIPTLPSPHVAAPAKPTPAFAHSSLPTT